MTLFALAAFLLAADILFGAIFLRPYYLAGPVVVRITRSIPYGTGSPPTTDALQAELRSFFFGSLVFEDFGAGTYGFRRSLLHGSGILQSIVVFPAHQSAFEVQGRMGWAFIGFVICAALAILQTGDPDGLILLPVVVALLTLIDFVQCRRAASAVIRLSTPPSTNHGAA